MVPQLVGEGLQRLLPPVEALLEPGEGREGAVVEDDSALDPFAAAVGGRERDAFAQGVDLVAVGMGDGSGRDGDLGDAVEELGGHLVRQSADHGLEVGEAHWCATLSSRKPLSSRANVRDPVGTGRIPRIRSG